MVIISRPLPSHIDTPAITRSFGLVDETMEDVKYLSGGMVEGWWWFVPLGRWTPALVVMSVGYTSLLLCTLIVGTYLLSRNSGEWRQWQ